MDYTITKLMSQPHCKIAWPLMCRQLVLDSFQTTFFNKQNSSILFHLSSIQNEISLTTESYLNSPGYQTQIQRSYKVTLERSETYIITYQVSTYIHKHPPGYPDLDLAVTMAFLMVSPQHTSHSSSLSYTVLWRQLQNNPRRASIRLQQAFLRPH